ncbi:MAG TPA: hypothetical protein VF633_10555 [Brevundimonas sp.]|jgi:hypothetical protein
MFSRITDGKIETVSRITHALPLEDIATAFIVHAREHPQDRGVLAQ